MAAVHTHTRCGAGLPVVVELGWFGALRKATALGDVIDPRHAERQDGVSDWYLPKGILADASSGLADAISTMLRDRGVPVNEHAIYSTPALLAESREVNRPRSRRQPAGLGLSPRSSKSERAPYRRRSPTMIASSSRHLRC